MQKKDTVVKDIKNPSRRSFIKKAVASAAAVTSLTSIAKIVAGKAARDTANKANLNDNLLQDKIMTQKKYVLMTKKEKEQTIETLINSYKEQA